MADFKVFDNGDGGDVGFNAGDILGEYGYGTAIYLSLFGGEAFYEIYSKYKTDNKFEESLYKTITSENLRNCEKEANKALKWLKVEKIVADVSCFACSNGVGKINLEITITEPNKNIKKYGLVWEEQELVFKNFKKEVF